MKFRRMLLFINYTYPQLKNEWWKDFEYSKWIGSEIIKENKALVIKCPSAIVEMESNYLINPLHTSFKKVGINVIKDFRFDERLFKDVIHLFC